MISSKIKIAFSDEYVLTLPKDHKFPIDKYWMIPHRLTEEKLISQTNFFAPDFADRSIVELSHEREYINRLMNLELEKREVRKIGFPQSRELIEREFIITEGTVRGALYAMENGVGLNIAGGTHHAYSNRGEGFCIFNDVAVASNYLLHRNYAKRVLIVDLDVHQGNGSAQILADNPDVFTFSMHGASNYPLRKEKSDLDVGLPAGTIDPEYLDILKNELPKIIETFKPEFIFYIAGVDVLESDRWGSLSLTLEGAKQRDEYVFNTAKDNNIPVFVSMGGGYSRDINQIVEAHCNTFRCTFEIFN
jgi:acetoin utilization deacetylase AcuC-like enzyme